jgi:predicted dehydrogenase
MNKRTINVGVIGYGYWGPNLVRNFASLDESTVTVVADRDPEKLQRVSKLFPSVLATQDAEQLITSADVDAVAIATPVSSHYALAKAALLSGKHVLVEKPITTTSEQAEELIRLASDNRLVLMVDHTFIYTGAIRKIGELIDSGELGELYYFDTERINLGLLQQDVNVVWDLATHDLSILLHLIDEKPTGIRAFGYRHIGKHQEMAELNLRYESGFHAHIRVSWLSPVKMRLTMIGGSRRMIVYDDVEPSEKVRVYDKGIALGEADAEETTAEPIYRAGDVFIPKLDRTEALEVEGAHFLDCIRHGRKPLTGGAEGLAVVRILEAAEQSLNANSELVSLEISDGGT